MNQYALVGKFTMESKNRDALIEILGEAVNIMRDVASCKQYIVYKDAENEEQVWVSEIWDSKDAHDESLSREDVRAIIARAIPLLQGTPEQGTSLIPVVGKGL